MTSPSAPALGILLLDRGAPADPSAPPPELGSMRNPASFPYPTLIEVVPGAWADSVIKGDPGLEPAYVASAKRLVERGAIAISSNCGFTIRHQLAVANAVDVPVALSSLLLLPTLLRQLPPNKKLGLVTADSKNLGEELLDLDNPADRARVVIGGIEGGTLWQNEMVRPPRPTSAAEIEPDVVNCVNRLRDAHPDIGAFLFECTGFPMVTPTLRRLTGLPIYDILDLCNLTFASVRWR